MTLRRRSDSGGAEIRRIAAMPASAKMMTHRSARGSVHMWGRIIFRIGQEEVPGRIPYVKGAFWKSDDPDLSMHDWVWQRCRFWLTEFNKVLLARRYFHSNLEE